MAEDWVSTNRSRREASLGALRSAPGRWARRRLRKRSGLSTLYSAPSSRAEVLERLVALPMSVWSYGFDDETVRHLGPMAQDFARAFGLGDTDRMINTLDAVGVCMAATQALHARVRALETEVRTLREQSGDAPPQNSQADENS